MSGCNTTGSNENITTRKKLIIIILSMSIQEYYCYLKSWITGIKSRTRMAVLGGNLSGPVKAA